jgi:hypothetical protein
MPSNLKRESRGFSVTMMFRKIVPRYLRGLHPHIAEELLVPDGS